MALLNHLVNYVQLGTIVKDLKFILSYNKINESNMFHNVGITYNLSLTGLMRKLKLET